MADAPQIQDRDEQRLAELGYKQDLARVWSGLLDRNTTLRPSVRRAAITSAAPGRSRSPRYTVPSRSNSQPR